MFKNQIVQMFMAMFTLIAFIELLDFIVKLIKGGTQ